MEDGQDQIRLIRVNSSGEWVQLQRSVLVHAYAGGLVIRDRVSNTLLGDFPANAITKITKLNDCLVAIESDGKMVALQFSSLNGTNAFFLHVTSLRLPTHTTPTDATAKVDDSMDSRIKLPNLEDPLVQEYVLKLLFSDEFKGFVKELKVVLSNMDEQVSTATKK